MKVQLSRRKRGTPCTTVLLLVIMLMMTLTVRAQAANLPGLGVRIVDANGNTSTITAYRWLLEEDKTYHVQTNANGLAQSLPLDPEWEPNKAPDNLNQTLSTGFHRSYMPVVAKGCVGFDDVGCNEYFPPEGLDPDKHYYVSVVPRNNASIGGAVYDPASPAGTTVFVNEHPIPTAQITILIFEDNNPINNAPDLPEEDPLENGGDMSGFRIIVEDAGGRFGASAGQASVDAFGNPLGTIYDEFGNSLGWEPLVTDADGRITIKNLAPGKYGIMAVPPAGLGWQQTSTIEGTKVIDAWVKANEPPFFAEFGPPGYHVFIGFIRPMEVPSASGATISGSIVNQHMSRPPNYSFHNGTCFPHTTPWVGLNDMAGGGTGTGVYAASTFGDCEFNIQNVPDGNYQLVVWDNNLDLIFAFYGITIVDGQCNGGSCNLGEIPVFQWFTRMENRVFDDYNADGMWDLDEVPSALEQAFNLRWRDGTVYQTNVSDGAGAFAFDQVFPFFSWLVAEVDFVRFQATGVTVVVDNGGGPIPGAAFVPAPLDGNDASFGGNINPQDQTNPLDPACILDPLYCEENSIYRVERGPVLTQGFQGFIGQTSALLWGKRHYPDLCEDGVTECITDADCGGGQTCSLVGNGGISGVVFYAVTRAENDPRYAAAEVWEPGIPGVTVNLYQSLGVDPDTGVGIRGALVNSTTTDSWDDSLPTGCKYGNGVDAPFMWTPDGTTFYETDCYDGLRNFNQVRPAVFDGGYAFDAVCETGLNPDTGECDSGFMSPIPVGKYIVEVIAPPGYELLKPEDKNVDFGDEYLPVPELLPPTCVGDLHAIPQYLTLFPDAQIPAPYAGTSRPLCDRKLVTMSNGANVAADFHLFTEVPIAAHGLGFILDDTQNEFDPNSPNFGEKYAPPFVPVTIRDWTGRVISKTLSDQFGHYNFLAPSTITANLPMPSGMSPNMLTTCMNDPGDDPANPDPNHNQQYSTFCYTFQYMPGATTYLDTPVVPVAAFAGPDQFQLDCEFPDGTPRIKQASVQTNGAGGGPYIPTAGGLVAGDQVITITSMESQSVPNPEYCNPTAGECPVGADTVNRFINRDYGFGASAGTVSLGDLPLTNISWSDATITATVAGGTAVAEAGGQQLTVTRANGEATRTGLTVQVGLRAGSTVRTVTPGQSIQTAIDTADTNDLILVQPGIYNEIVVMWKPVQLQGWGAGSTLINAVKAPPEKLQDWRLLVDNLISSGVIDLVPGQEPGLATPEPTQLFTEEGAGVLVLAKMEGATSFGYQTETDNNQGARVDGFTIKSADTGGGIVVNGYGHYLDISNNFITNNSGFYGGGIRVGHPELTDDINDEVVYTDSNNDFVNIHHNQVNFNGALGGAGGGVSMCTGSDSYRITENWICGNFSMSDGGGIGHVGLSDRADVGFDTPLIENNTIIFNESFFQGQTVSGGGIFVSGGAPLVAGGLTAGAGNVRILNNQIKGNSAGAGDGGGLRLAFINGADVAAAPDDSGQWYSVDVYNNMIANNVSGLAGAGISLQDAVNVNLGHNTIANNDSLATAGEAFAPGSPNQSTPQPGAGIVSRVHSTALAAAGAVGTFSDPAVFTDNIVWQNRQFFFWIDATSGCTPGDPGCTSTFGICPDVSGGLACPGGNTVVFNDLAVIGTAGALVGTANLVTPGGWTGPGDPSTLFVAEYFNGNASSVFQPEVTTAVQAPPAFDEGGNFIRPRFGPLALYNDAIADDGDPGVLFGDYHILAASLADDTGSSIFPALDIDGEDRTIVPDIGADEIPGDVESPVLELLNRSKRTDKSLRRSQRSKSRLNR